MAKRMWLAGAGAACAAALVGALAVSFWPSSAAPTAPPKQPRPALIALPATPAPPPAPAPKPAAAAPVILPVAAAAPTRFTMWGPKFTIRAHVCGMPNVRPLDPPGEQHHTVCWVNEGFGVAPGSNTATTYVLGHSWAEDDLEVLNQASEPATRQILAARPRRVGGIKIYPVTALNGYHLRLRTATGTLTYTVHDTYGVAKSEAGYVRPLMNEKIRNRIAIITCAELGGVDYDYDVIIDAYLTSSAPRSAST